MSLTETIEEDISHRGHRVHRGRFLSVFSVSSSEASERVRNLRRLSGLPRAAHGFTLVELLVVISIIAILAGMVMPMFYSAKERARESRAKVEVKALETAFKSYLDTYKIWPDDITDGKIEDKRFKMLRERVSATWNSQGIAFYEFGSTNSSETMVYDPWAPSLASAERDKHVYRVMFDANYDNIISVGGQDIYRCVVVWSPGKDGEDDSGGNDDVASWK